MVSRLAIIAVIIDTVIANPAIHGWLINVGTGSSCWPAATDIWAEAIRAGNNVEG